MSGVTTVDFSTSLGKAGMARVTFYKETGSVKFEFFGGEGTHQEFWDLQCEENLIEKLHDLTHEFTDWKERWDGKTTD